MSVCGAYIAAMFKTLTLQSAWGDFASHKPARMQKSDDACGIIGGGTRGAGGATAPPDFKIYAFGPPRFQNQKLTNIGW